MNYELKPNPKDSNIYSSEMIENITMNPKDSNIYSKPIMRSKYDPVGVAPHRLAKRFYKYAIPSGLSGKQNNSKSNPKDSNIYSKKVSNLIQTTQNGSNIYKIH